MTMTDDADYVALATFHDQLRRTIDSTEHRTRQAGLQSKTFLMLLALRRQPAGTPVTIGRLAEILSIDRNEVVELVDDLVRRGFVARERDRADRRRVLISLTPTGAQWVAPITLDALQDLVASGPELLRAVRLVVAHAAAKAARTPPPARADVADFAWRATGAAAPI
jgi:DNA-binding MarR family transcriptional regulator